MPIYKNQSIGNELQLVLYHGVFYFIFFAAHFFLLNMLNTTFGFPNA